MKKRHLFIYMLLCCITSWAQMLPYQNPNLSSEERAKDLLCRLTLVEKAKLMCDISEPIPRLNIKKFNWWSEALHGYASHNNVSVFPQAIGMAASFDDKLLFKVFDAVSDEARALYNEARRNGKENERFSSLSVWTPNINIFRDPRWGRGQETYGEDPYLTSTMGIAVVKGLQGPEDAKYKKLLACAKHYAVHSGPEWSRHILNINNVSNRELWETYLPAFKALVQDADVRQVMCAYQRLDDDPCCGSTRLLQRILREDWGYKHLVVSDCGAIADFWQNHKISSDVAHAASRASLAGTDVECGFGYAYDKLPDAVAKGLISENDINMNVLRVLIERFDLGEMDKDELVPWSNIPISVVNSTEHQDLALMMARETMTLLQNNNHVLPLKKSERKIAIIGPNADNQEMLWGNYNGTPAKTITILEGIKSKIPADKIIYETGCDVTDDKITESLIDKCKVDEKNGLKATYWNNREFSGNIVSVDQYVGSFQLTTAGQHEFSKGVHLKGFSAKYETVFIPTQSGEVVFRIAVQGDIKIFINDNPVYSADAQSMTPARIPLVVVAGKEYKIEVRFIQKYDWTDANFKFNLGKEVPVNYNELANRLKDVDVVIFVGGLSAKLEGEEMAISIPGFKGGDRTDIQLPASQRRCLQTLKKAGKKVIFVNCSGSAVGLVPETQSCDAILQAWYGGESGGQAVADVLFGDYNPAGKLPITFYKDTTNMSDIENYSMKGRTYRYLKSAPLFPFGYGLSYTNFSIGNGALNKKSLNLNTSLSLTIPVKNIGKRSGTEVVQVYVRKIVDGGDAPLKTLRAFQRVEIPAGKTVNVNIELPAKTFEWYDVDSNSMKVIPGDYELFYGSSSDDKDLKKVNITLSK